MRPTAINVYAGMPQGLVESASRRRRWGHLRGAFFQATLRNSRLKLELSEEARV